jgi:hypothetical protein
MLDALNSWQLVREASRALTRPAATSFKHVAPAGAAVAGPVDDVTAQLYGIDRDAVGALTSAYLRARDADPKSSYGDFAAVSHPVDTELAELLSRVVCDGIIAPATLPARGNALSKKKSGRFLVMEADQAYTPPQLEKREVFGLRLTQQRDELALSTAVLDDARPMADSAWAAHSTPHGHFTGRGPVPRWSSSRTQGTWVVSQRAAICSEDSTDSPRLMHPTWNHRRNQAAARNSEGLAGGGGGGLPWPRRGRSCRRG